jgi:N-acetylmuramoyl-L-alanine amidase
MPIGIRTLLARTLLGALRGPRLAAEHPPEVAFNRKRARLIIRIPKGRSLPLVVLDPGLGGKKPEAIGFSGTYEKRVALAAGGLLKQHSEVSGKCSVRLPRQRDVSIPRPGRVAIAERNCGSFLISIHAGTLVQRNVQGASVYTFGLKAPDRETTALSERENKSDRFASSRYRHLQPAVRQILSSQVVEETKIGSATMQRRMVRSLRPHTLMLHNPSREAYFAVLRSVTIPSVVVETGLMSNRMDERLLRQTRHRTAIAAAMPGAATNALDDAHNLMLQRS